MQRPRRVVAAHPGGGRLVVGAVARLVAQRPGDDGGVVAVAQDHARDTRHPLREVARVVTERGLEGVRLDVRLLDDVEAQLVGQVQEGRVVGVVRGAHGVEAVALHGQQVPAHGLRGDDAPGVLVEVVAVDTLDAHASAVDEQVQAADLHAAEADPGLCPVDDRAVGSASSDTSQVVQPRHLRGPGLHVRHAGLQPRRARAGRLEMRVQLMPARLVLAHAPRPVELVTADERAARPCRSPSGAARSWPAARAAPRRGPPAGPRRASPAQGHRADRRPGPRWPALPVVPSSASPAVTATSPRYTAAWRTGRPNASGRRATTGPGPR